MINLKIIVIIIILILLLITLYYLLAHKNINGGTFRVYTPDEDENEVLNEEIRYFNNGIFDNDDVYLFVSKWDKYEKIIYEELRKMLSKPDKRIDNIDDEPIKFTLQTYGNSNVRIMLYYNGKYELIKNNNRLSHKEERNKIRECYTIIGRNKFDIILIHHNKLSNDIDIYLFNDLDEAEEKLRRLERKRLQEINDDNNKQLDRYPMLVSSKYFDTTNDYINLERTNRKYEGMTEEYKYNPIPITDKKQLDVFKNIETYHRYNEKSSEEGDNDELEYVLDKNDKDKQLKTIIWKKTNVYTDDDYYDDTFNGAIEYKCVYHDNIDESNAKTIEFPDNPNYVNTLIDNNFEYYKISSIDIPTNVTSIGNNCFRECSNLVSINIPPKVEFIGNNCFSGCKSLISIDIPSKIEFITDECFSGCSNLVSINIPSSVTYIGNNCFEGCINLSNIKIDEDNPIFVTDSKKIYRKDDGNEV